MSIQDNKNIAVSILSDWLAPSSSAALADDLELTIGSNPKTYPAAAKTYTKTDVLDVFRRAQELFEDGFQIAVGTVTGEGDRVVVEIETTAVLKSDPSRRLENPGGFAFEFRDGVVHKICAYSGDTQYMCDNFSEELEYLVSGGK